MDIFPLTCLISSLVILLSGIFVYFRTNDKKLGIKWFLFMIAISIWIFGQFCRLVNFYIYDPLVWDRITRIGVIMIPITFINFTYSFLNQDFSRKVISFFWTATVIFLISDATPFFIKNVMPKGLYQYYPEPGATYYFFVAFFLATVFFCLFKISKEYLRSEGIKRTQMGFYLLFTTVGFIGGITNFLPVFDFSTEIYVFGTIIFATFPILSTYSILKYNLFNLKTITAEILSLIILIALSVNIVLSDSFNNLLFNLSVFLIVLILVTILLKSVWKEVKAKETFSEMVKQKTKDLRERNDELEKFYKLTIGREVRMAELKEKIKELEKNNVK